MAHYICTGGCGGEAEEAGICKAEDCPFYAEELEECNCEDGRHEKREGEDGGEKEEE